MWSAQHGRLRIISFLTWWLRAPSASILMNKVGVSWPVMT